MGLGEVLHTTRKASVEEEMKTILTVLLFSALCIQLYATINKQASEIKSLKDRLESVEQLVASKLGKRPFVDNDGNLYWEKEQ